MTTIAVIIVNWNTRQRLEACLRSIASCSPQNLRFATIVADNASSDGSPAMIRAQFPSVTLIENRQNLGFAAANNQALRASSDDFILLLNPDTIVHPEAIDALLNHLWLYPEVGAVGPKLLNADGSCQVSAHPEPTLWRELWRLIHLDRFIPLSQYPEEYFSTPDFKTADVLMGACILLRREVLDQIGLFDEQFFIYSEEVDLCQRIRQAGWRIHYLPAAQVTHFGAASTCQVAGPMFIELYRNKLKYFRKHDGELAARRYRWILRITALLRVAAGSIAGLIQPGYRQKTQLYRRLLRALPDF